MPKDSRWRRAQTAEIEFWKNVGEHPVYKGVDLGEYWRQQVELLAFDPAALAGKSVLDLGSGPVGIINFLPVTGPRWALDPLFLRYAERLRTAGVRYGVALGEAVPLASGTMDVIFCFNVLDHVADPTAVLGEVRRLLRQAGTVYVMVHTFPSWLKPFLFFDRPHTFHWTREEVKHLLERAAFRITREHHQKRKFPLAGKPLWRPSVWPYVAAEWVVTSSYYTAQK